MINESFMGRVRDACRQLSDENRPITSSDVGEILGIKTCLEKKRVSNKLHELLKNKELSRIAQGVYWLNKTEKNPLIKNVMWRLLNARETVSLDELQGEAGASRDYALEWIKMLVKRGMVRKEGERYRLIQKPGTEPENADKAARLRRIRAAKKKMLDAMDELVEAII